MNLTARLGGEEVSLEVRAEGKGAYKVKVGAATYAIDLTEPEPVVFSLLVGARSYEAVVRAEEDTLRVVVAGRSYEIALEDPRERTDDDLVVDLDGLSVALDPVTAADLTGSTVDLDAEITGGGLRIDNPNEGWQDPLARAVQEVLDRQINPGVGSHGGMVTLVEVRDGAAYLRFGGGCQGCGVDDRRMAADLPHEQRPATGDPVEHRDVRIAAGIVVVGVPDRLHPLTVRQLRCCGGQAVVDLVEPAG